MSYTLSGVALVTGASRGIGRAIAERLASAGMKVAVAARTQNEIEDVALAIGGIPLVLDVTNQEGVARAVDIVEHKLGAIDLLVNNAGTTPESLKQEVLPGSGMLLNGGVFSR